MDDPTTTGTTEGIGLMFYNARFYSPCIMQFIQPDTIIPELYNPQSLNRYSYVNNNPIRYNDPTGHIRVADQDMQLNHASMNCSKYPQYCNNGKPKSADELAKMREPVKQPKNGNWFHDLMRDKNTPMVMATVQEVAAGIGEAAVIATVFQPELAPVSAIVFTGTWIAGRVASAAGTAATTIQYRENLNGTNGTDMIVSWGTTLAGLNPAWSFVSSTGNFLYTAERTAGWAGW